jgi:hypothetical protein
LQQVRLLAGSLRDVMHKTRSSQEEYSTTKD